MGFQLRVNFLKGWPCPSIVDHVGTPAAGVTVFEGAIACQNAAGQWTLGASSVSDVPHVLWNGAAGDGDNAHVFDPTKDYGQVGWGGVQGIAFLNQIEVETAAWSTSTAGTTDGAFGTPAYGDQLFADTDGKLKVAMTAAGVKKAAAKLIVAICTKDAHQMSAGAMNASMISFVPDISKRITAA
jgi:hypothetical protein